MTINIQNHTSHSFDAPTGLVVYDSIFGLIRKGPDALFEFDTELGLPKITVRISATVRQTRGSSGQVNYEHEVSFDSGRFFSAQAVAEFARDLRTITEWAEIKSKELAADGIADCERDLASLEASRRLTP